MTKVKYGLVNPLATLVAFLLFVLLLVFLTLGAWTLATLAVAGLWLCYLFYRGAANLTESE